MIELQERIADLNTKVMDLYHEYVKLEGATGQIIWSIPWDELLEGYRRKNPNLRVDWRRLPIKESELIATIKSESNGSELKNTSGLKYAIIPGAKLTGFSGMGSGQKVEGAQLEPSIPREATITFGSSISGQIVLTLAGACPYFDGIENRTNIDINELTRHITANLVYTFELAARRGYRASYNLSSMLSKIEQKSKKGGVFSTSSAHSIINDDESRDWFSINFTGNTSNFQYSPEEQNRITQQVKEELFDKAFRQFAILNAGSSTPPVVPQILETGAGTAASELRKCWHWYCQAGSAILGVSNAIWGRSQATATFHRNNNVWASEEVNGIHFVDRSDSLSFRPE